ncbi:MAG TPA: S41 family peptidase [Chloroflexota bacterium]|nr:S41 family peptidase [Chloroflexota bacterium]
MLAGRRLLQAPPGRRRTFTVQRRDATTTQFSDTASQQPWATPEAWRRTAEGHGYLRVRSFQDGMSHRVDVAFADLAATESLIVDLRGNLGGSLVEALAFRDRFLRQPLPMGTVRYSTGEGGLSAPFPITAEPSERRRWTRRVRFLTDPLTCSASEDALLGLQGLAHVQVMGLPSGGGSGRPRSIRLLPGTRLSVSTALTYDRTGHCIEGAGIPVDVAVNWYGQPPLDQVPAEATRAW